MTLPSFFRQGFLRHAALLQLGSFLQYGVGAILPIAVARFLGPGQYGVWALISALSGLFVLFFDVGQRNGTIVLAAAAYARHDREGFVGALRSYLKTTVVVFLVLGIPALLAARYLGEALYQRGELGGYVRILILASFVGSSLLLVTIPLQIVRRVRLLAALENIDQAARTLFVVIFLLSGAELWGVVFGQLVGAIVSAGLALWLYHRLVAGAVFLPALAELGRKVFGQRLSSYLRFCLPIALDKNLADFYQTAVVLILGRLVATDQVGFFNIALGYISASLFILGPVSRLLHDQFPKDQARDPRVLRRNFLRVSVVSGLVAGGAALVLVFAGPFLVRLFYGAAFEGTISLIAPLWLYATMSGFGVGLGGLYRTLNLTSFTVKLHVVVLAIGITLSWYLVSRWGVMGAVYGMTFMRLLATGTAFLGALWFLGRGKGASTHPSLTP